MIKKLRSASMGSSGGYLTAFALLTLAAVMGQTLFSIYEDRAQTMRAEHEHGLVAVRLLEENASQTLQDAAHRVDGVVDRLTQEDLSHGVTRAALNKAAQGSERDNRTLPALQFVAPSGHSWVTSLDYAAFEADQDSRSYIGYLREKLKLNSVVIASTFTRYYDGKTVLPLARNLHGVDGQYLGVISTDIDVSYFRKVYERVAKENRAMVALVSNTGFLVTRSPFDSSQRIPDLVADPVLLALKQGPEEGTFLDEHFLGGREPVPRMYAYRKLGAFPFVAIYARTQDDILLAWRDRVKDKVIYSATFILVHLALTVLLMRHIRQRKLAEHHLLLSEQKFSSLFQLSPVPLAVLNLGAHSFADANHAMLKQFRYPAAVFRERDFYQRALWSEPAMRERFEAMLGRDDVVKPMEARLRRQDGGALVCELSARTFDLAGEKMAILSIIDLSAQREAEREILELNEKLRQRVASGSDRLAAASDQLSATQHKISKMQIELMRAEKMAALGALVAGVAHELNTPLGNCITVGSTMEHDLAETKLLLASGRVRRSELDEFVARSEGGYRILLRNLERALELITAFKQVAVDQDSNVRRRFEVGPWMKELLFTLTPMYKSTPFELHGEAEPDLLMDSYPGALGQVVGNLIGNSLMHAFEGRSSGTMNLSIWRHSADQLQFIYSDDGVGIPEENLARVCDPFFTTKLGQGGSGLGMHIVYNLVTTLLGGSLDIGSAAGKGVKMVITLPLVAPSRWDGEHRTTPLGSMEAGVGIR